MTSELQEYLSERGRIAGRAGRGKAKRIGANASWTPAARERRKRNLALKHRRESANAT